MRDRPLHLCSDQEAGVSCPPGKAILADALRRFETEASHGVCDTGRYRCAYSTWGEGPPLLFIPGLSDGARSFIMLSACLASSFRCIAYDLPAGRADGAQLSGYTHAQLVDDLFALLDHVQAGQSYVLGSSFGSTIALAALHAHPGRVPRAVLQGGFARRPLAPAEVLLARLARSWPGCMRRLPFRNALLRHVHYPPFADCPLEQWEFFLECWGSPPMAAVAHRALLLHQTDLRPILPQIRQPVLLVCGDRDPLVKQSCEDELLRGLPHVGRVELNQCGHNPLYSHPEALAEVVRGFLTPPQACSSEGDRTSCPHASPDPGSAR